MFSDTLLPELAEAIDRYRAGRRAARSEQVTNPPRPGQVGRLLRWLTPNGGTLLLVALLVLTQQVWAKPLLGATSAPGPSAIPASGTQAATVNYQGRLADSGGTPLDGNFGMHFALYDAANGGDLVWGRESHAAVPVSDGLLG